MLSVYIRCSKQKNFLITSVYILPKTNPAIAMEALLNCNKHVDSEKQHCIVGGDFNLDYLGKANRKHDRVVLVLSIDQTLNKLSLVHPEQRKNWKFNRFSFYIKCGACLQEWYYPL